MQIDVRIVEEVDKTINLIPKLETFVSSPMTPRPLLYKNHTVPWQSETRRR